MLPVEPHSASGGVEQRTRANLHELYRGLLSAHSALSATAAAAATRAAATLAPATHAASRAAARAAPTYATSARRPARTAAAHAAATHAMHLRFQRRRRLLVVLARL